MFYILCDDWRKNRKHSYVRRSNRHTWIPTCTCTFFSLIYRCISLYFYLDKDLLCRILLSTRGYVAFDTANRNCEFRVRSNFLFPENRLLPEKAMYIEIMRIFYKFSVKSIFFLSSQMKKMYFNNK